ncbi:hypothetical protein [Rubrolithibacter danxiaensis]|uniref:hypothetical protein n=1 Tax=Rubrolithibacter danxiaensis TaxID=3390805 RepID=UPI003BF86FA9
MIKSFFIGFVCLVISIKLLSDFHFIVALLFVLTGVFTFAFGIVSSIVQSEEPIPSGDITKNGTIVSPDISFLATEKYRSQVSDKDLISLSEFLHTSPYRIQNN